jgi:hypothetical protein
MLRCMESIAMWTIRGPWWSRISLREPGAVAEIWGGSRRREPRNFRDIAAIFSALLVVPRLRYELKRAKRRSTQDKFKLRKANGSA